MGVAVAKGKAETTIKARVFDENRELLADLGIIVGKQTKEEKARTGMLLKMLEDRSKAKRKEEMNNG